MSFTNRAAVDTLRTLDFSTVDETYLPLGDPLGFQTRIICFTNTTDQDMILSMDGVTDQLILPESSFKLFDVTVNHRPVNQDDFCFAIGTQWYVRYASDSPSEGAVYLEVVYAEPY